jgi:hypothetical protein
MPQKDWRTDNWANRPDIGRDPRQYHFPRSTKEIGWGEYQPHIGKDNKLNWWMVAFFIVLFLLFDKFGAFNG